MTHTDVLMTTLYLAVLASLSVVIAATSLGLVGAVLFLAGVLFGWLTSP